MASRTPPTKKLKLSNGVDRKELCTPCQFQEKKSTAVFECTKCMHYFLCKQCQIKHNENANTKDHVVIPLDQASQPVLFCPKHPGRCMNSLCVECDKPICDVCIDLEHGDHSLKSLKGIAKEISDAMEPLISSVSEDFNHEMEAIKSAEDTIIKKVHLHAEVIKAEVDRKRDRLVLEIMKLGVTGNAEELAKLQSGQSEVLRQGEELLSSRIESLEKYNTALDTKKALKQARAYNAIFIDRLRRKRTSFEMATFVPSKTQKHIQVGDFVISPAIADEKILTLKLLGSWTLVSCCEVGRAVIEQNGFAFLSSSKEGEMNFIRIYSKADPGRLKQLPCSDAVNMIAATDRIQVISSAETVSSLFIPDTEKAAVQLPVGRDCRGYFCAETKEGKYVIVGNDLKGLKVSFRHSHKAHQEITSMTIPNQGTAASTSIGWVKSLDMLLIHDVQKGEVLAYTLEVQNEVRKNSPLTLKHCLEKRLSISSPLPGFYIVETYCTDNRVYLSLRKGNPDDETIEAAPVKIYEARYRDNRWEMTSLKLVKPDGEELSCLEKDQQIKIAANGNQLLCLVYKPAPVWLEKVNAVPRISIACYVAT